MNRPKQLRPDQSGPHRAVYEKNKRRLLKTTTHCEICGGEINRNIKWPDPLSPVVDHIIAISRGGHPSDIDNMRIVHNRCNRAKADKLYAETNSKDNAAETESNVKKGLDLPWSINWLEYRSDE
jgi:5-methylcytosine-specific restriction endonuclease McrA